MQTRKTHSQVAELARILALVVLGTTFMTIVPTASAQKANEPQLIDDSQLQALSTTVGGASVLPTTRTIPHWWGSTLDPHNGITYGYNMVGANPNTCSGSDCSVTIEADMIPLIVNIAGLTFSGNDILAATLASPQFALNDYGTTPFATAGAPNVPRGAGGYSLAAGLGLQPAA
jgi:hypothetical protein